MKVSIIGAGNMGGAIGTRAIAGGHEVEIVDLDPPRSSPTSSRARSSSTLRTPWTP
ncbi:MAG: NAD(P)-binding domain-containing protein [Nitriliruptorales bacterium]